jgi:integrase
LNGRARSGSPRGWRSSGRPSRARTRTGTAAGSGWRGFARYVATLDPATEVPSKDLLRAHRSRLAPHIYTPAEIDALIAAAGTLAPPLRALRHQTLIGLLAATGLRPGEALALDRRDVDLEHGTLHVRAGKNKTQREVRATNPRRLAETSNGSTTPISPNS